MRGWVLLALIGAMACEDTPPAGTRNLLAPSQPVFFEVGGQELLGFIDQGHDAVRLLDLTAGTYQWGTHPYFPRAVRLDDSVIDLAWSGSSLVALSASGQAYEVPAELAAPTSLSLALPAAGAYPLGLVDLGANWARLDNDCSLAALGGAQPAAVDGLSACVLLGDALVHAMQAGESVLAQTTDAGLQVLGASPGHVVSAHAAADGGWWLVTSDRRRLVKIDAQGAEVHRFVLPFEAMDMVESSDADGPLLAVVGLNTGVLYLRADGTPEGPFGERTLTRPIALTGEFEGIEVRRDEEQSLAGRDLFLVGAASLGSATVTVAAVDGQDQQFTLTPAEGSSLPSESLAYATLSQGESSCSGRLDAQSVWVVATGTCPVGEGVSASFTSSAWHAFAGTALLADQTFDAQQSLGAAQVGTDLTLDGHVITATQAAGASLAVVALRGQTGLGSLVLSDGWFSGITAAAAKTNYSDTEQTWLWLTSSSENAVVQLPIKSNEYYQILIFR